MNLTNNPLNIDVDAVVQAVVAELRRRVAAASTDGKAPSIPQANGSAFRFEGRLLGARQVEALGGEVRRVEVGPGTIVTPLAKEDLKRRGIAWGSNGQVALGEGRRVEVGSWAIALSCGPSGKCEAIRRTLLDAWADVGGTDLAGWVLAGSNRGGLLLTDDGALDAWRANQTAGVRAATAIDAESTSRAVRSLGVNLLVVEPAGLSILTVRAIANAYRAGGAPVAPGGLR